MLDFRTYGVAAPPHAHDFMQVVMPARGVLEMDVDGRGGRVEQRRVGAVLALCRAWRGNHEKIRYRQALVHKGICHWI